MTTTIGFWEVTAQLGKGFGVTCLLFVASFLLSLVFGLLLCRGETSKIKPLSYACKALISVIRGTPLILQIIVVYYVPGLVFDYPMRSKFLAVLISFVIHYSCYFAEIYRGGLESVSVTQTDAGCALDMTKGQIFWYIKLPQIVKNIIPPLSNETLTMVKDTSLASTVGLFELFSYAKEIEKVYVILWPLFYAGLFYFVFNFILSKLFRLVEKKFDYYKI